MGKNNVQLQICEEVISSFNQLESKQFEIVGCCVSINNSLQFEPSGSIIFEDTECFWKYGKNTSSN